ncbi:pseudaminic acid cytidylyltransferase [Myroides odoratimimus]|uniref:pseudaminic acid cytidylyltransferase n=1 Tax=Myroides odoratimimus TaxID=76832 RepID=UPI00370BA475
MVSKLCIIPARGGSKRIPRKNIKNFLGKPIIAYSIEVALSSGLFDEVMVSTDDDEIADVAKKYGAKVPFFRSKDNSNDFATLSDVIDEVKIMYQGVGKEFDYICCILPTAPFVSTNLLKESFNKLVETKQYDSIRPIVRFSYPIQRAFIFENSTGLVEYMFPDFKKTRSQDLEEAYHDAGLFYWMKYKFGLNGDKRGGFIVSEKIVQDIDTLQDWEIAEMKYKILIDM